MSSDYYLDLARAIFGKEEITDEECADAKNRAAYVGYDGTLRDDLDKKVQNYLRQFKKNLTFGHRYGMKPKRIDDLYPHQKKAIEFWQNQSRAFRVVRDMGKAISGRTVHDIPAMQELPSEKSAETSESSPFLINADYSKLEERILGAVSEPPTTITASDYVINRSFTLEDFVAAHLGPEFEDAIRRMKIKMDAKIDSNLREAITGVIEGDFRVKEEEIDADVGALERLDHDDPGGVRREDGVQSGSDEEDSSPNPGRDNARGGREGDR